MGKALLLVQEGHTSFLEGPAGQRLMGSVEDVRAIVEECFSHGISAVLLYEPNLTDRFFDLSSGETGAILQKLFQYRIRLAIVRSPGDDLLSSRFGDMMVEEARRGRVGVFDSADAARAWIKSP